MTYCILGAVSVHLRVSRGSRWEPQGPALDVRCDAKGNALVYLAKRRETQAKCHGRSQTRLRLDSWLTLRRSYRYEPVFPWFCLGCPWRLRNPWDGLCHG